MVLLSALRSMSASLVLGLVLIATSPAYAHEMRPAIADMTMGEDRVVIAVALNLEAVVTGIGSDHDDTDDSPEKAAYDAQRNSDPAALSDAFDAVKADFLSKLTLQADDTALSPSVAEVNIPEIGDTDLARESIVTIESSLPAGTDTVTFGWDGTLGALILRAPGKTEPYSAYLTEGKVSEPIAVTGAETRSTWQVVKDYVILGYTHILPKGLDHILFVVGLFLLSARLRPLLWQVTSFTLAHTVTLALGITGVVSISPSIVEPLIAASIVWVCIENIFSDHMAPWRPLVVFAFGLLHGLGFAGVLGELGMPSEQFITALISFNVGVELGQLTVIAVCFLAVGLWFRDKPWYRRAITIPGSLVIAAIGAYWFFERVGLLA